MKSNMTRICVVFCTLLLVAGCGGGDEGYDGPPRSAVSGTVTLDGSPLDSGVICFVPRESTNRAVSIPIAAGSYSVPEGKGPNFGVYDVVISGSPPSVEMPEGEEMTAEQSAALAEQEESGEDEEEYDDEDGDEAGSGDDDEGQFSKFVAGDNILPEKYNLNTELSADVTASSHTFDFELSN